jgi:hypothetical protein
MINYKKIYCKAYGYYEGETIPSEISGYPAVDVCHIENKGMGGNPSKDKDRIENLMAKTRFEHESYGDKKQYMSYLFEIHKKDMQLHNVKFDEQYIDEKIEMYSHYKIET